MTSGATHSEDVGLGGALGLMLLALALILLLGGLLSPLGLGGLVLVELSCFALPAWITARVAGTPRRVLALGWPRARVLAGAALVGVSFWFIDVTVFGQLSQRWMSPTEAHRLTGPIVGPAPLVVKLLVLALVPAVCEELLVRGAIARGLRPRLGLAGAAVISAAYFAVLHGSLARALPVGVFGAVLAVIALRAEFDRGLDPDPLPQQRGGHPGGAAGARRCRPGPGRSRDRHRRGGHHPHRGGHDPPLAAAAPAPGFRPEPAELPDHLGKGCNIVVASCEHCYSCRRCRTRSESIGT